MNFQSASIVARARSTFAVCVSSYGMVPIFITITMEQPPEIFAIRRHGAVSHSRGRIDGRLQEARILDVKDKDEGQFRPGPVRVLVRNGVRLDEPEIIEFTSATEIVGKFRQNNIARKC